MRKTVFPVLIAVILLLCGCSSDDKRLNESQYAEAVESCYTEYTAARKALESANPYAGGDPDDFREAIKRFQSALSSFENIEPPEKYEHIQRTLKNALSLEQQRLNVQRDLMKCVLPEDEAKLNKELKEIDENKNNLEHVYKEIQWQLS